MRLSHAAVAPLIVSVGIAGLLQALAPIQIQWSAMWAGSMMTIWGLGWWSCLLLFNSSARPQPIRELRSSSVYIGTVMPGETVTVHLGPGPD